MCAIWPGTPRISRKKEKTQCNQEVYAPPSILYERKHLNLLSGTKQGLYYVLMEIKSSGSSSMVEGLMRLVDLVQ